MEWLLGKMRFPVGRQILSEICRTNLSVLPVGRVETK